VTSRTIHADWDKEAIVEDDPTNGQNSDSIQALKALSG
jgi:hypothetical protein